MQTAREFRRMALGMKGATEGKHMGHPDFRAHGRIFATLHPGNSTGMVKLRMEDQKRMMTDTSGAFRPAAGAWGLGGATLVTLATVDEETLGEALTLAWRNSALAASAGKAKKKG